MKLKNLKASFILKERVSSLPKVKNVTFKQDNFTFNIYHHSPYLVNVTGVKTFERLKLARKIIEEKLRKPFTSFHAPCADPHRIVTENEK